MGEILEEFLMVGWRDREQICKLSSDSYNALLDCGLKIETQLVYVIAGAVIGSLVVFFVVNNSPQLVHLAHRCGL